MNGRALPTVIRHCLLGYFLSPKRCAFSSVAHPTKSGDFDLQILPATDTVSRGALSVNTKYRRGLRARNTNYAWCRLLGSGTGSGRHGPDRPGAHTSRRSLLPSSGSPSAGSHASGDHATGGPGPVSETGPGASGSVRESGPGAGFSRPRQSCEAATPGGGPGGLPPGRHSDGGPGSGQGPPTLRATLCKKSPVARGWLNRGAIGFLTGSATKRAGCPLAVPRMSFLHLF
jgi:hypothetical protein